MSSIIFVKGCSKIKEIGFVFVGIVKDGFFGSGMHATVDGTHIIVDRVEFFENEKETKDETTHEIENKKQEKQVFFTVKNTTNIIPSIFIKKTILFQNTENPYRIRIKRNI